MKYELAALNGHLNVMCSKVSCASWHLGTRIQIPSPPLFFFYEIPFQFIHGYSVLKWTPFSVGNAKAEGMHCIFAEEMSKNFGTWPRNWSAAFGFTGGKRLNVMAGFLSLFEVIFSQRYI